MLKILSTIFFAILWLPLDAIAYAIPQFSFNMQYSDRFDTIMGPRYSNLLNDDNAVGLEFSFGSKEFRAGGTWAGLFNCHHLFRFTAEHLAQKMPFVFDGINLALWDEQYALGADYTFITRHYGLAGYRIGLYQSEARDEHLEPRLFVTNNYTIFRDVKGSLAYGSFLGVTLQPIRYTKLETLLYYDNISFRNQIEPAPDRQGFGVGVNLEQILHPRILVAIEACNRRLYSQYSARASWLVPIHCNRLELALQGDHVVQEFFNPAENRIGLTLSYRWNLPCPCQTYLTPKSVEEDIVAASARPVVRMPQVFSAREQFKIPVP